MRGLYDPWLTPEQRLLNESNAQKSRANKLFTSSRFSEAIGEYDKALSSCPNYLDYECAVLKSNIAACHLKLEEWKEAVQAATAALESLDRLQPTKKIPKGKEYTAEDEKAGVVVEIEADDEDVEKELAELRLSDERKEDIRRMRAKALMRRAKGRIEQGGWASLAGAEEGECPRYRALQVDTDIPRLQRAVQDVQSARARSQGGTECPGHVAREDQCCKGGGNGGDDEQAEGGRNPSTDFIPSESC